VLKSFEKFSRGKIHDSGGPRPACSSGENWMLAIFSSIAGLRKPIFSLQLMRSRAVWRAEDVRRAGVFLLEVF